PSSATPFRLVCRAGFCRPRTPPAHRTAATPSRSAPPRDMGLGANLYSVAGIEYGPLRDHHHALLADREAPAVRLEVVADRRPRRHDHALVDDGAPDLRVPPDLDVVEQDRLAHVREAVHAHARAED